MVFCLFLSLIINDLYVLLAEKDNYPFVILAESNKFLEEFAYCLRDFLCFFASALIPADARTEASVHSVSIG